LRHHGPLALAACLVALSGCGGPPGPACFPVRGSLTCDQKPLAEALVVLHPLEPLEVPAPKPVGYSDAAGQFQLTTLTAGDGAPAGRYRITVELRAPRKVGEEIVRDGPNLLAARYANPETSTLVCEVVAGENVVGPLEVAKR
jgi:hypothetical protein